MTTITQTGESTFTASNGRGTTMTLSWNETCGYWQMTSDNASRRAWRGLGISVYRTLADVEKKYKSWRGLSDFLNDPHRITWN